MHYAKVKKNKVGKCNLCLTEGPLSWDHVPPQGSFSPTASEIRSLLEVLTARELTKGTTRDSQNGVKFRTICSKCNSWLGREVDPTLIRFTNDLGRLLTSRLALPQTVAVQTLPNRLVRGVLAHLVASKVDIDEVPFDGAVRSYLFDLRAPVPDSISLRYWMYPYKEAPCVSVRDFGVMKLGPRKVVSFCQLLKFFPVAFMAVDPSSYPELPSFDRFRESGPDESAEVRMDLRNAKPYTWPETPDDTTVVFGGQAMADSVVANRRKG